MIYDAGFNLVLKVEYSNKNSSGTLSKLYTDTGRGVFFIGQRCDIAHVLFNEDAWNWHVPGRNMVIQAH